MLDRRYRDVVAVPERAVLVDSDPRNDEERQTLGSSLRAFDARENQVDDVVSEIVVATANENLGALDAVGAVVVSARAARCGADIGAGVRLGETHGPRPFAAQHFWNVFLLLLLRAELQNELCGGQTQAGVHRERRVRTAEHLLDEGTHHAWRILAAPARWGRNRAPTCFPELVPCTFESVGRDDTSVFDSAALFVTGGVQGADRVAHETVDLVQDHVALIGTPLGVGFLAKYGLQLELLEEQEPKVS